jgi:serine/threonine protein phosphatase PrpC
VWLQNGRLTLCHTGDTVAMLLRPGAQPRQLNRIHDAGGAIYRYFGLGEHLEIDTESLSVEEGDLILLFSDGVTKAFNPMEAALFVEEIFARTDDVAKAAEELASRSRGKGSNDDITVVLLEVEE